MHEHAYIIHVLINMQANKYFQVKALLKCAVFPYPEYLKLRIPFYGVS